MLKKKLEDSTPGKRGKKRNLENDFDLLSNNNNMMRLNNGLFGSPVQKYKVNSVLQTERLHKLVSMIVKCMLPISIVENKSFKDYISYLDPSFSMPTRSSVKNSILPQLKSRCQNKIKSILNNIPSLSTSMDSWTDSALRPYNGFIAQGIDLDWQLHTISIEFEYMSGMLCFIYV